MILLGVGFINYVQIIVFQCNWRLDQILHRYRNLEFYPGADVPLSGTLFAARRWLVQSQMLCFEFTGRDRDLYEWIGIEIRSIKLEVTRALEFLVIEVMW